MRILATRKKHDLICWGLEEPISHLAICFFDSIIFHAKWCGVSFEGYNEFMKDRYIIEEKYVYTPDEISVVKYLVNHRKDLTPYDKTYFFWLVFRGLLLKLFRRPIPKEVESENGNAVLCSEIFKLLPAQYRPVFKNKRAATPYRTFLSIGGTNG